MGYAAVQPSGAVQLVLLGVVVGLLVVALGTGNSGGTVGGGETGSGGLTVGCSRTAGTDEGG